MGRDTMKFGLFLAAVAALGCTAMAATPYERALTACRADAMKAFTKGVDNPTGYKCNWATLVKGAPGAALTGKFAAQDKLNAGTLTIIEGGDGPALDGIQTTAGKTGRQCTVAASGGRGDDDILNVKATDAGCNIRIKSSGPNVVSVTSTNCQSQCGLGATFDGTYRLSRGT